MTMGVMIVIVGGVWVVWRDDLVRAREGRYRVKL